jgi:hypothetical protein
MQRPADAQLGELGGEVMKQAGQSGSLGAAAQLGSSIVEMQHTCRVCRRISIR